MVQGKEEIEKRGEGWGRKRGLREGKRGRERRRGREREGDIQSHQMKLRLNLNDQERQGDLPDSRM